MSKRYFKMTTRKVVPSWSLIVGIVLSAAVGCDQGKLSISEPPVRNTNIEYQRIRAMDDAADKATKSADIVVQVTGSKLDNTVFISKAWEEEIPKGQARKDMSQFEQLLDSARTPFISALIVPVWCENMEHVTNIVNTLERKGSYSIILIYEEEHGFKMLRQDSDSFFGKRP
jgi:hypothetical protein